MTYAIPEAPSTLRTRSMVYLFAIGPLRSATEHLRRGKGVGEQDGYEMRQLYQQCTAFCAAYETRCECDVLED